MHGLASGFKTSLLQLHWLPRFLSLETGELMTNSRSIFTVRTTTRNAQYTLGGRLHPRMFDKLEAAGGF